MSSLDAEEHHDIEDDGGDIQGRHVPGPDDAAMETEAGTTNVTATEEEDKASPHAQLGGRIDNSLTPVEAYVESLKSIRDLNCSVVVSMSSKDGADHLNPKREARIGEITEDYGSYQAQIASYAKKVRPSDPTSANLPGYVCLKQCQARAQVLLAKSFDGEAPAPSNDEAATKVVLQRIILDASARRLVAFEIAQRAAAVVRWEQRWQMITQGRGNNSTAAIRAQLDSQLRTELAAVTNQSIYAQLREKDQFAGCWIAEDPTLPQIQAWIQTRL